MQKKFCLLISFVLISGLIPPRASQRSLLSNGNFETGAGRPAYFFVPFSAIPSANAGIKLFETFPHHGGKICVFRTKTRIFGREKKFFANLRKSLDK